jgi:anti-sigma B factor antagonist
MLEAPHFTGSGAAFVSRRHGSTATVAVRGEVDLANASEFGQVLDALTGAGARFVVLDLSATTFFDASGLGIVATRAAGLEHLGGALTVRAPSPHLERLFEITGLSGVIRIQ